MSANPYSAGTVCRFAASATTNSGHIVTGTFGARHETLYITAYNIRIQRGECHNVF